jgi:hypothetical protein
MNEFFATSSVEFFQSVSLASSILFALVVFLGTYIASRLYGFLGVCIYIIGISIISIVLSMLLG